MTSAHESTDVDVDDNVNSVDSTLLSGDSRRRGWLICERVRRRGPRQSNFDLDPWMTRLCQSWRNGRPRCTRAARATPAPCSPQAKATKGRCIATSLQISVHTPGIALPLCEARIHKLEPLPRCAESLCHLKHKRILPFVHFG